MSNLLDDLFAVLTGCHKDWKPW